VYITNVLCDNYIALGKGVNISGQIPRKLSQIANTFLLGAYRKVAKGRRMVTSPMVK